jgi:hypothetical protein
MVALPKLFLLARAEKLVTNSRFNSNATVLPQLPLCELCAIFGNSKEVIEITSAVSPKKVRRRS